MKSQTRNLKPNLERSGRGISLIELLISVFIMSVGILGISALQGVSLQQNRSALLRSEAVQLGNDILDRIRANRDSEEVYATVALTDTPVAGQDCTDDTCTPAEMAAYDIAQWQCSLYQPLDGVALSACTTLGISGTLPGGVGSIQLAGGVYTVIVEWVDDRDGSTSRVTLRAQP